MKPNRITQILTLFLVAGSLNIYSGCKPSEDDNLGLILGAVALLRGTGTGTDTTAPAEVSGLGASAGNGQVVLSWTDPTDTDFDHVEITWSPGGATVQTVVAGAESYTATSLTNGTVYTFTVKTVDATGNVSTGTTKTGTPRSAGDQSTHTAGGVTFNMRYVPGKNFLTGFDDLGGTHTVSADYWLAETEVTYELWLTVKTWAESNGYTFANAGVMGDGTGDTNQHPVTTVNWRSAMVWMNALTEWYNAKTGSAYDCVYYSDRGYTTPIRDSSDGSFSASTDYPNPGSFDDPYVKSSAKGFRLPTSDEWELAARYIDDANGDGDIIDAGEYYPGSHISGDTSNPYDTSSVFANYAWYTDNSGISTNVVATKTANALGLYDMSGNVWEWNFDWHPSYIGTNRVIRGGSWDYTADQLQVGWFSLAQSYIEFSSTGFRPSRTE